MTGRLTRLPVARWALFAAVIAAVGALAAGSAYSMQLFSNAMLIAALALGLNVVTGFAGQMAFAQAAYYGVGAYASADFITRLGAPFPLAFLASIAVAAACGLIIALPSNRLGGSYFAIVTIGLQAIAVVIFNKWTGVTGGAAGIYGIPLPAIGSLQFRPGLGFYILAGVWLFIIALVTARIRQSKYGWELRLIRNDADAALAVGVPVKSRKLVAFLICCGIAGGSGSLYASFTGVVAPNAFDLTLSATLLVTVFLGGRGSVPAVIISALVLNLLPEYLRALQNYRILIFGVIMVVLALFLPDGLAGLTDDVLRRRRTHRPPAVEAAAGVQAPAAASAERGQP
jgi:branched-chain amino acid transport system permease protein